MTSTDRLTHVSEYHYTHQPKHGYEHVKRLRCATARPGGNARSRSQACRSVLPLRPLPAHAARTVQRRSPSRVEIWGQSKRRERTKMKPHADARLGEQRCRPQTTRNRRARSAASSSRPRRTRCSCTPLLERLTSMRHRTNTEALLRPPSTSMPRSCRTDRGGHRAVSGVEDASARPDMGVERGSDASDRGRMDGDLPFSQCDRPLLWTRVGGAGGRADAPAPSQ